MNFSREETILRRLTIGKLLREARAKVGLSQVYIARQLGYSSPQFISNWERGISLPPLNNLTKLVSLLEIVPDELIEAMESYQEAVMKLHRMKLVSLFQKRKK